MKFIINVSTEEKIDKINYIEKILNDEEAWDEIDEYHSFLKSEMWSLCKLIKKKKEK